MSGSNAVYCPVSREKVNENVVRLVAGLVILATITGWYTASWVVFLLLAVDFGLRAFTTGVYSPFRHLAQWLARKGNLDIKLTDAAPKKFAAGLGLFFSFSIALAFILNSFWVASFLSATLIFCAFLESALGICLGCIVFAYLNRALVLLSNK